MGLKKIGRLGFNVSAHPSGAHNGLSHREEYDETEEGRQDFQMNSVASLKQFPVRHSCVLI